MKHATDERARRMGRAFELYEAGATVGDIATEMGLHSSTVHAYLHKATGGRRISRYGKVVEFHQAGLSDDEIAEKLKISPRTVCNYIARWRRGNGGGRPAASPGGDIPYRVVRDPHGLFEPGAEFGACDVRYGRIMQSWAIGLTFEHGGELYEICQSKNGKQELRRVCEAAP